MKKIYLILSLLAVTSYSYGQLIINEVLYDPSNTALEGDANGDGIYSQDDDSFIEIYNDSSSPFDISGFEIWDDTATGGSIQYIFPANTTIPAEEVVVVFGGGTLTGSFGSAVVLKGDSGLNFNNSGEVIGIKDTSGAWTLIFDSDALSNNPNESYTRFPDVTGAFLQHGDTTNVLFSPGTKTDGTAFNPSSALIINEVLYDPSNNALDGDANRDSIYSQDDDSFIEIYNSDTTSFDISGYEIWDDTSAAGTIQYTFPTNTSIPAEEVVVVFGGGTPTGTFGSAVVLNAMNGFNFNNSGEVIGVKDTSGAWVLIFNSDELSNNPNESYTRFPDVTGDFLQHGDTTNVLFSPGTKTDGTPFNTLTGITKIEKSFDFNLYPNPATDQLTIQSEETIDQIEIFNISGQILRSFNSQSKVINIQNLGSGIYFIRLRSDDSFTMKKFIKQ